MTIPRYFFFIFYGETFNDLAKVKRGLSKMGSISRLHHSSMTKAAVTSQQSIARLQIITCNYAIKLHLSCNHLRGQSVPYFAMLASSALACLHLTSSSSDTYFEHSGDSFYFSRQY